ncbi:MAG: 50S ribosomal protein L32 [Elusimicrobiota bacterium]
MPNPKRKHTRSRRDSRRSQNWKLDRQALTPCSNPNCGKLRFSHAVCPYCGFYNGRSVLVIKQEKEKPSDGPQGEGQN